MFVMEKNGERKQFADRVPQTGGKSSGFYTQKKILAVKYLLTTGEVRPKFGTRRKNKHISE